VAKHLLRNPLRTASTVAAMALCVLLFCTLESALLRFNRVVDTRSPRRLVTRHGVSFMFLLPRSYADEIRAVPGVTGVASANMFGGLLPARREGKADAEGASDWADAFQNMAVEAEPYFAINPELHVDPGEFHDFLRDLRGCVLGREMAGKFGWKVGDHFFLESFVSGYRKKSGPFEFVVRGLVDPDPRFPDAETSVMLFHFKYLDEGLGGGLGAGIYIVEIGDPARAAEIGTAIDALFENTPHPTVTESEKAWSTQLMSMAGDMGALVHGVGLGVCFTVLLVTANTMSMAVRERRTEVAVLKTLGFRSAQVLRLIVAEGVLLGALGGLLGLLGAIALFFFMNHATSQTFLGFSGIGLTPRVAMVGLGASVLIGFVAGFLPAWGAYRARVTDMLRPV
jgi:putative ABC transport system permease protein